MSKAIQVRLTSRAKKALEGRAEPLVVELELYFSCLIRKRVLFPEQPNARSMSLQAAIDGMRVFFRPVVSRFCAVEDAPEGPELETITLVRAEAFTPKWVEVDFRNGGWSGEFGYGKSV